ncbi:MAG: hypothetical protein M0023_01815 [Desulfobacteraceae bacterium]|nr:hypothetical protein [Desulfobacteraceae bacterium]
MADTVKKAYYFKCLDFAGYWKVIWFGRLSKMNDGSDNVTIYVYIGKLAGPEKYEYALPLEYKRAELPIGQFPVLYIEAILKDGYLIPSEALPNHLHRTDDIHLDLTKNKIEAFSRVDQSDKGLLIPMKYHWDFYKEPQADSYLLAINHNNNPHGIIIPCAEILRFFYCYASNIARVMTSDRILDPGRWLYDPKESGFDKKTGIVSIKPRLGVTELTATFLANFISEGFDLKRAQLIPKQVAIISRAEPERPFVAFPPFDGNTRIHASFKQYENEFGKQTVITRIISTNRKANFKVVAHISTVGSGSDGGAGSDNGRAKIYVNNPPDQPVKMNTGAVNPNLGVEMSYDDDLAKRFPHFNEVRQVAIKKEINKRGTAIGEVITTHSEGSTSSQGESGSDRHHILIQPDDGSLDPANSAEIAAFCRIQASLQLINAAGLASVSFLKLTEEIQEEPEDNDPRAIYNLPEHGHDETWAYIDKANEIRRRFIVAKVVKEFSTKYLIEFEQKRSGECSTLLIWNPDTEVPGEDILAAVEECISNNATYLQTNTKHSWSKLKHSWKKNEHLKPGHFLDRIFSADSLLRGI